MKRDIDDARGLGAVTCYDPYFTRSLLGLKRALADGHPILVRLHAAAQYPAPESIAQHNDREGHAVLVVGYDDQRQALAVSDPWDPRCGGAHAGLRWIGYSDFYLQIVDSSLGCAMVASPLQVQCRLETLAGEPGLLVTVGFYAPEALVMDHDSQVLEEITVTVTPEGHAGTPTTRHSVGPWRVGEAARLWFPATTAEQVQVTLDARIGVARPYPFSDRLTMALRRAVEFVGAGAMDRAAVGT